MDHAVVLSLFGLVLLLLLHWMELCLVPGLGSVLLWSWFGPSRLSPSCVADVPSGTIHHCALLAPHQRYFKRISVKVSKYSLVQPQIIHRTARSIYKVKNETDDSLSYLIEIKDKKHRIHLHKNREFLHPKLFSDDKFKKVPVHCYYHGEVEGYSDSMVAVSTCSGLRGIIVLEDETFGLEPLPGSTSNQHVLYVLSDVNSEPSKCGVLGNEETHEQSHNRSRFEPGHSLTSLLRKKRSLPTTSYVELALIVDNRREMVQTVNVVDGYYKRLNIRVMLVHLEVFTKSNPFSVDGSAGEVLGRFVKWRKENLLPRSRNDVGQFVIGRTGAYSGSIMGMAFVGTVCSSASGGGINVFTDTATVGYFSTIVAHELGHNLGMNHDSGRCKCDGGCIMDGASGSFSTCSENDFENLLLRGGGECLKNVPSHSDIVGIAKCGNGLLEEGEQCDCGTPEECKDKCCDAATCKFTKGSVCAAGRCCQDCQLKVAGTPCRRSENSCDLPEFCTGKNAFCPDDFYIMDGLQCQSGAAYCYEGRCQTYDYQCRQLFSQVHRQDTNQTYDYQCRQLFSPGTQTGHVHELDLRLPVQTALQPRNVMCGKLQCTNVDANKPPPGGSLSNQVINGSNCVNADFNLGPDVLDPGYSKPGSPCAPGKTCVDFKCVDASVLLPKLDCDAKTTCNGRGVCNDQGHCHCNIGWAPPNCASGGRGGSKWPPDLLPLIVPLLVFVVLLLLYIFRRDTLDPCLKRGHKSRSSTNGTSAPPRMNVPPRMNIPPPAHATTPAPDLPVERECHCKFQSLVTPNKNFVCTCSVNWRYGELDYWKTEGEVPEKDPEAPMRPPPPLSRQGPGAPRPIPPRTVPPRPPKMDP
ncbi:hypothetical protein WMY93_009919 [Mugilogobius chulae]|uniref:Disintegrin and metalloproteinase domain-containing protein 9-like n=1 Tax=Mugilogobius chulae TaxID=88201 RepID=A0AAW0P6B4_9GOBI